MASFYHDPAAIETFSLDWSRDLASGETISSSSWTLDSGLTNVAASNDTTTTSITVSGGTAGQTYAVRNDIVTSAGATYSKTNFIICERAT